MALYFVLINSNIYCTTKSFIFDVKLHLVIWCKQYRHLMKKWHFWCLKFLQFHFPFNEPNFFLSRLKLCAQLNMTLIYKGFNLMIISLFLKEFRQLKITHLSFCKYNHFWKRNLVLCKQKYFFYNPCWM